MADPAAVEGTIQAQNAAQAANDGYQRAISLADESIVLVGAEDTIAIVPPGDPWHARLREVLQQTQSTGESRFKVQNDQALWVRSLNVPAVDNSTASMKMSDLLKAISEELNGPSPRGPPIYLEARLARQMFEEGHLVPAPIGVDLQVRVLEVKAPEWTRGAATTPDIWRWDQGEWIRPPSMAAGSPPGGAAGGGGSPGERRFRPKLVRSGSPTWPRIVTPTAATNAAIESSTEVTHVGCPGWNTPR